MISYEDLSGACRNEVSQNGENGLLEYLCKELRCTERTCVEFGAWDAKHLSNVYPFWRHHGWKVLLIEGEASRSRIAAETVAGYDALVVNKFVEPQGANSLSAISAAAGFPARWDILSIDIDGREYEVLEHLDFRRNPARIVVVEFNNSIPPHIRYVSRGKNYTGSSALSMVELMACRGYQLIYVAGVNLFFVSSEDFNAHFGFDNDLRKIFDYSNINYLMSDYAGNLLFSGLPNHSGHLASPISRAKRMLSTMVNRHLGRDPAHGGKRFLVGQLLKQKNE